MISWKFSAEDCHVTCCDVTEVFRTDREIVILEEICKQEFTVALQWRNFPRCGLDLKLLAERAYHMIFNKSQVLLSPAKLVKKKWKKWSIVLVAWMCYSTFTDWQHLIPRSVMVVTLVSQYVSQSGTIRQIWPLTAVSPSCRVEHQQSSTAAFNAV